MYQLRRCANHQNHYRSCHWQERKSAFKWSVSLYLLKIEVEEEPHWHPCCFKQSHHHIASQDLVVRNMRSGIRGSLLRFCIARKAANSASDPDSKENVCSESHPPLPPLVATSFAVTIA